MQKVCILLTYLISISKYFVNIILKLKKCHRRITIIYRGNTKLSQQHVHTINDEIQVMMKRDVHLQTKSDVLQHAINYLNTNKLLYTQIVQLVNSKQMWCDVVVVIVN